MAHEGYVDVVNDREISGWIFDDAYPNQPLTLEILAGDSVLATVRADGFRADLVAAGKGNGRHAFRYSLGAQARAGQPLSARVQGKRWRIQPTLNATSHPPPLHHDPRRKLLHTLEYGYPQLTSGFTSARSSADEATVVGRVIEAFHRAVKDDPGARSLKADVFAEIGAIHHIEILELLRRRHAAGVAEYLRDAHAKGLAFAITQGREMTASLRASDDARRTVATEYMDNLVSLAEFLGILEVESPAQQGRWGENLHTDPQALADSIAAHAGFPIQIPPVIGSYFGIETRGGIITGRDLSALYAALQLRNMANETGILSPAICEIGGGLGGVAYYAARMGMDFTLIDVPLAGVLQGYFLLRALPDLDIQLYGEQESPATTLRLLPTFAFNAPSKQFDILFNQDAFPEMHEEYALGYLQQARTNVKHLLYSINQESRARQVGTTLQTTVSDLVTRAGGFRRASRFRHWLRAGYVEEVYRKII